MENKTEILKLVQSINNKAYKLGKLVNSLAGTSIEQEQVQEQVKVKVNVEADKPQKRKAKAIDTPPNPQCAGRVYLDDPVPCQGGPDSETMVQIRHDKKMVRICKRCKLYRDKINRAKKRKLAEEKKLTTSNTAPTVAPSTPTTTTTTTTVAVTAE